MLDYLAEPRQRNFAVSSYFYWSSRIDSLCDEHRENTQTIATCAAIVGPRVRSIFRKMSSFNEEFFLSEVSFLSFSYWGEYLEERRIRVLFNSFSVVTCLFLYRTKLICAVAVQTNFHICVYC